MCRTVSALCPVLCLQCVHVMTTSWVFTLQGFIVCLTPCSKLCQLTVNLLRLGMDSVVSAVLQCPIIQSVTFGKISF